MARGLLHSWIFGLTAWLVAFPAPAAEPTWRLLLEDGQVLLEQGDAELARQAFESALADAEGECLPCRLGLAQAAAATGDFTTARAQARRVLRHSDAAPDLRQALAVLRAVHSDGRAFDREAVPVLRRLVDLADGGHEADLAGLLQALGRLEDEAAILELVQRHLQDAPPEGRARLCLLDPRAGDWTAGPAMAPPLLPRLNAALLEQGWPGPYFLAGTIEVPVALRRPPVDTSDLRLRQRRRIRLQAVLDEHGRLGHLGVTAGGSAKLLKRLAEGVGSWSFEPARTADGRAVPVCMPLRFDLAGQPERRPRQAVQWLHYDEMAALDAVIAVAAEDRDRQAARDLLADLRRHGSNEPDSQLLLAVRDLILRHIPAAGAPHRKAMLAGLLAIAPSLSTQGEILGLVEQHLLNAPADLRSAFCALGQMEPKAATRLTRALQHLGWPGPYSLPSEGPLAKPERRRAPTPRFPKKAKVRQGLVVVRAVIGTDGKVGQASILHGTDPSLNESTLETLERWRFEPARLDGQPVPVCYVMTTRFSRTAGNGLR